MADQRWQNNALGIDISSIQKVVDYTVLKPYVDFYIARAGHGGWTYRNVMDPAIAVDTMFAAHCQGAYDTGKPFGAYWVFDPTVIPDPKYPLKDRQIAPLVYALGNKVGRSVNFLAIDVEIWQTSEGEIPPNQIADYFDLLIRRLHNIWPDLKIGIYTGEWFFEHSPNLKIKIDNLYKEPWFFAWLARYPYDKDAGLGVVKAEWADFRGKYAPEWPAEKSYPWMSNGEARIWQYSGDKYTAEGHYGERAGLYSSLDLNYFNGNLARMKDWCGYIEHAVSTDNTAPVTDPVTTTTETTIPATNENAVAAISLLDLVIAQLASLRSLLKKLLGV